MSYLNDSKRIKIYVSHVIIIEKILIYYSLCHCVSNVKHILCLLINGYIYIFSKRDLGTVIDFQSEVVVALQKIKRFFNI